MLLEPGCWEGHSEIVVWGGGMTGVFWFKRTSACVLSLLLFLNTPSLVDVLRSPRIYSHSI